VSRQPFARFADKFFQNVALRSGTEWMVSCPFHGGHDSLQFNVKTGKWVCFGCGKGGSIQHLTDEEVPDYTPSMADLRSTLRKLQEEHPDRMSLPVEWLAQYDIEHVYWSQRGLFDETIAAWRLGYDIEDNAATIPLWAHDGGSIHGVIKRSLDPDVELRYRYPRGFNRQHHLYGEHRVRRGGVLYVTEGSIDAIACSEAGQPAVAVLGSSLTKMQRERLLRLLPERIVLAFDNDKAGRTATDRARSSLRGYAVSVFEFPGGIKDFGDLDYDERVTLIKEHNDTL